VSREIKAEPRAPRGKPARKRNPDLSGLGDPTGLPTSPAPAALPDGWQVVRLEDVSEKPQYGYTAPATQKPVGPKMLRITDIQEGRVNWSTVPYCECSQDDLEKYALHPRDIVFARTGSVGKAFLISQLPEKAVFASYLIRVRVSQDLDAEYCYFFMQSPFYWQQITSQTHGAVQPNVNATQLRSLLLPLPPLPEQRAIARVLATIQRAVEAQDQLIAATRAFKRALMRHLFTYGAVPPADAARVPLKDTEIGAVPVGWEVKNLGQIAEIKGGKRLPKGHKFSDAPTQYPYIRVVDLENGTVNKSNLKFLKPEDYEIIKRYTISQDDVYISIAGTIGLVGIIPKELNGANLTENAAKIVINNPLQVDQQYLAYFLASEVGQAQIASRTAKTSQPKLALARIQQIPFLCPSLAEQRAIARILTAVDAKIAAEEKRKAALQTLFKTMLHQLMTGQIRVNAAG
jgi:type I restriction enzyme S subunit